MIFDPPLRDLTAFARLATKLLRYEVELDWKFSKLLLNRKGLNFSQARKVMRNCNPPTRKKNTLLCSFTDATTISTYFFSDNDFIGDEKKKNFACEQIRRSSSSVFPSAAAFLQALLIAFHGRKFIRTFYSTII